MVIGAGHRHHFGDPELAQPALGDRGELGRITNGAGRDDRALALHQPRDGCHGADSTRVGEDDRGAGEVVGDQLADARFRDERFVLIAEGGEIQAVGVSDDRNDQHAAAILTLDVDRESEVHAMGDARRVAVDAIEGHCHRRHVLDRARDGERDQVRVGDLFRTARFLHALVELTAPLVEHVDAHCPKAGGGRHLETFLHVLDQCRCRPAQGNRGTSCPSPARGRG